MKIEYVARKGSRFSKKDAKIIGPVLERLREKGRRDAPSLVREARKKRSPVHPYFTWDKDRAAQKCWVEEAEHMLRSIQVMVTTKIHGKKELVPIRRFHCVKVPANGKGSVTEYLSVEEVQADETYVSQVVDRALRELEGWRFRYALYGEQFAEVFKEVDKMLARAAAAKRRKKKVKRKGKNK